jgi:predicted histone-like DNA-binding protein
MAIKFKIIERGQPGVTGGGTKKYYAAVVNDGELTLDDVTRLIEKSCTVNGADIRAVLYALVESAIDNLAAGKIVRLGDLGSMRMSISSEGKEKESDVTASSIKDASIIFTPGPKLKTMLGSVKYQKV